MEVIWEQANNSLLNPQSKYILGTAEVDSLGREVIERIVGLTFRDSTLSKINWDNPDTVLTP